MDFVWWIYWLSCGAAVYGGIWISALWWVLQPTLPSEKPLYDRFHQLLPRVNGGRLSEVINLCSYVMLFGTLLSGIAWNSVWLEQFICYLLVLKTLRCFCFNLTVLPDASQKAHLKPYWSRFLTGGVRDLIFSGHMTYLYAPLWFLYQHQVIAQVYFCAGCLVAVLSALNILCRRDHYSIDLVVAIAMCHFAFDLIKITS